MKLNLSAETEAWLKAQVQSGRFASYEDAIGYTVKLAAMPMLRHKLSNEVVTQ